MLALHHVDIDRRLRDVSLALKAGQLVQLIGPNGAGKSSLLWAMAGLLEPDSGAVKLANRPLNDYSLNELATCRTMQQQAQHSAFGMPVAELLSYFHTGPDLPVVLEQALEIGAFMTTSVQHLSGGQWRRVHIAQALLQIWPAIERGRGLVLLDEPLQGLDLRHQAALMNLLTTISRDWGNLVVMSSHDLQLCYQFADTVVLMADGQLVKQGPASAVMTEQTLSQSFDCLIAIHTTIEDKKLFQTVEKDR